MQSMDVKCCVVIVSAIREILDAPCLEDQSLTNRSKLVRLSSVVRNQGAKTRGAGLRGGSLVEELWTGMLFETNPATFRSVAKPSDADYAFQSDPSKSVKVISHKTVSFSGTGLLALAWSKNSSGENKTVFEAHVGILFFRKEETNPKRIFAGLKNGFYLIPSDYMNREVSHNLGSNNKTDSLINPTHTELAMREALRNDCFIEIPYDDNWGVGKALDPWPKGLASVSTTHQPPAPKQLADTAGS